MSKIKDGLTPETLAEKIWDALKDIREENQAQNKWQRQDDHGPAYLIIAGFDQYHPSHVSNIINGVRHPYVGHTINGDMNGLLRDLEYQDGAIIIDNDGTLVRVGARLKNNTTIDDAATALGREVGMDEAETLGFKHEVGTRHINALYATFVMNGAYGLTLSGKTGDLRMYKDGRIVRSTVPEESQ